MAAPPPAYDYGAYAPQLGGPPAGSPSGSHLHGAPPVAAPPPHYHQHAPPPAYGAPPPSYYPPAYGSAPPPHHAPPPAYPGSYPGYPPGPSPYEAPASSDELRTVFVTGFPADVKERELNNLMRFLPGYQASQMNWKNGQAQGFALFNTGASASAALAALAHVQFDEASVLRVEMARKNMFVKPDDATLTAKRPRVVPGTGAPPPAYGAPPPAYGAPPPAAAPPPATYGAGAVPVGPKGYSAVSNTGDNNPCTTLFVGNLADDVSEAELHGLFGSQPGFKQMKMVRGARVTAFVEFDDLATAMATHGSLQGALLSSSNRGGIRLQYSKNPLGKRKDL